MLLGVLIGLSAAFVWSSTSLLVKAQATRIDTFSFNTFRTLVGALFFLLLLPFFGGMGQLFDLSRSTYLILTVSVILSFCIGDSIYFWSMTEIGASRAMPLSSIYPLFTWLLAVPLLGEAITIPALSGTLLIMGALFLLARETPMDDANDLGMTALADDSNAARTKRVKYLAVGAAVLAAFMWAVSTTLLRLALHQEPNALVVSAYRLAVGAMIMLPALYGLKRGRAWQNYNRHSLPFLIALAVFSTGLGSLLFVWAVEYAGAARAALLITTAPLIGVPLSALFLKERVTREVWLGTLLTVGGVWLVLL